MPYQAPEILDRAALGDDKYTVTELADGRKQLTPSPDEVSEPGTEINKALLQPMADALERIDAAAVPYVLYWWRRRPTATSYTENRVSAKALGYCRSHYSSSRGITFYYVTFDPGASSHTIQVASAISISQSSGAISLKNPTSYSYTESTFSNSTYGSICAGKYVKGLYPQTSEIYYIPSGASVGSYNWVTNDGDVTEVGYEYMVYDDGSVSGVDVKVPRALKNTAAGDWEAVSSPDSEAYPKSGTSDGYDWIYLGKIYEAAVLPVESSVEGMTTVGITSANFSSGVANITIPFSRYRLWLCKSSDDDIFIDGTVDSGKFSGIFVNNGSYSKTLYCRIGANYIVNGFFRTDITNTGIKISTDDSYQQSISLAYMPV